MSVGPLQALQDEQDPLGSTLDDQDPFGSSQDPLWVVSGLLQVASGRVGPTWGDLGLASAGPLASVGPLQDDQDPLGFTL